MRLERALNQCGVRERCVFLRITRARPFDPYEESHGSLSETV